MPFLQNCWYVAAWNEEVGERPFERRILGVSILMFRRRDGVAVALSNRCPHRFAPMHLGTLVEDGIRCPYHGLVFGPDGRCVFNPQGSGATPSSVRLNSYPLVERYGALWIWPGAPAAADEKLIPDLPYMEQGGRYARVQGYVHTNANYELMTDNIMDLSHVDYLHATSLGCEATAKAKTTVRQDGDKVSCDRWMPDDMQGPLPHFLFQREGPVDAWVDVRWQPAAVMELFFGMTDVGASRAAGRETPNAHFMTPETDRTTHYFWAACRDFRIDEAGLDDMLLAGITAAFEHEDGPMIEAQQAMMETTDFWSLKPALLASDAAPVLARRTLAKLLAAESASQESPTLAPEPTASL